MMINTEWYRRFYRWMDNISGNRAAFLIPLLSFFVIGGSASLLNLVIVLLLSIIDSTHADDLLRHALYSAIATEIAILYDFTLNDRFTFRVLIDPKRSWMQRCIRFHAPASLGFVLTIVLSSLFFTLTVSLRYHGVISQAIAILIVAAVNFLMHRFWTYRPIKKATHS